MSIAFDDFDFDGFVASAAAICHPDRQEIDWVAWAPDSWKRTSDRPEPFVPWVC